MARRVAGWVVVDGTDDEAWPESDEHVHSEQPVDLILDEGQPAAFINIDDVRWGGECRVEVALTARAGTDGIVQVEGKAKLFEGTSEATDDLEDEQTVTFTIARGGVPAHHRVQLRNSETFGGDHAEIGFSFTNSIVEDA